MGFSVWFKPVLTGWVKPGWVLPSQPCVRHIRSIHGQGLKFSCNDCSYITNRKDRLVIHVQTIHKGLGYACDECDYQTTQPRFLSSHKKNYHK